MSCYWSHHILQYVVCFPAGLFDLDLRDDHFPPAYNLWSLLVELVFRESLTKQQNRCSREIVREVGKLANFQDLSHGKKPGFKNIV
jgi:hypothetical protein